MHPGSPIDWAPQEAQREPKMCEISAEPRSKGPNALRQQPSADAPRRSTDRTRICARAHSWTIVPSRPAAALEFDPHLRRDWAHPAVSSLSSTLRVTRPPLRGVCNRQCQRAVSPRTLQAPCRYLICTAPGLEPPPHLHRDRAHPCHMQKWQGGPVPRQMWAG